MRRMRKSSLLSKERGTRVARKMTERSSEEEPDHAIKAADVSSSVKVEESSSEESSEVEEEKECKPLMEKV